MAEAAPAPSASGPTQHVIVLLKNQHSELPATAADAGRRAQVTDSDQAPLVARAKSHGGKDFRQLHVANAFATAVPAAEAAALAADPSVAAVVPDKLIKAPSLDRDKPSKAAPGPVSNLVCPTDPSKPLLEPEALQVTHTASPTGTPQPRARHRHGRQGRPSSPTASTRTTPTSSGPTARTSSSTTRTSPATGPTRRPAGPRPSATPARSPPRAGRSTTCRTSSTRRTRCPPGCNIRVGGMAPGASLVGLKVFGRESAFNSSILAGASTTPSPTTTSTCSTSPSASNPFPDTSDDPIALFNEAAAAGRRHGRRQHRRRRRHQHDRLAGHDPPVIIAGGGTTIFRSYAQTTATRLPAAPTAHAAATRSRR